MRLAEDFDPRKLTYVKGLLDGDLRHSAELAEALVARGRPEDLAVAEPMIEAILACQDRRPGSAHRGNFLWNVKHDTVRDLNAVEFMLRYLLPLTIRHGNRLSPGLQNSLMEAIRLGCDAIRDMDVAPTYTNVAVMDSMNSILGGELLDDEAIAGRGYRKLDRIARIAAENGTVYEFDSPTYHFVTLDALKRIADLTRQPEARIRARTMAARLGLTMALHIHLPTGRWAGPHSRAYPENVLCNVPPEILEVREAVEEDAVPAWTLRALERPVSPWSVEETALAEWQIASTAYHTDAFAMGTATREVSWQTDVFMIHYRIPGEARPGVLYTRYRLDDTWYAENPSERDRAHFRGFTDWGKFYGVQDGPRALGVYSPKTYEFYSSLAPCSRDEFESAKLVMAWTQRRRIDEIRVGGRPVDRLPVDVAPGETVVVTAGDVHIAVRPLAHTDLGCGAPIRLREVEDELILEIYNYLGPRKGHNVLEWRSRFYRGQPQCGFYVEVAERSAWPDAAAFQTAVDQGALRDEAAPPFTAYMERADRPWVVEYARDGRSLGMEVNLMEWTLKRRWTEAGEKGFPMLESPTARQTATGRVEVGGAVLECGQAPAWLFADPAGRTYAAGYHGDPAPLCLTLPEGRVSVPAMGTGTVVWDRGDVTVEAIGLAGRVAVRGGRLKDRQGTKA